MYVFQIKNKEVIIFSSGGKINYLGVPASYLKDDHNRELNEEVQCPRKGIRSCCLATKGSIAQCSGDDRGMKSNGEVYKMKWAEN